MKRYICKTLFLCALLALFTGCRARQQVIRSDTHVADKTPSELFSDIIANHFQYNTFSARLNISLQSGMSSRANIRIIRDEALRISVQPLLGIEMFRLYVSPEWVVMVDRMGRRYVQENIASLQEVFPAGFDFYTLQALFTNALFVPHRNYVVQRDYRHFHISLTYDMQYFMQAGDYRSGSRYSFLVNGDDRITIANLEHRDIFLNWRYDNFAMVGNHAFPHRMNVELRTAEPTPIHVSAPPHFNNTVASAEITFSNIATNEAFEIYPVIPNGFSRMSLADAIRIFSALM